MTAKTVEGPNLIPINICRHLFLQLDTVNPKVAGTNLQYLFVFIDVLLGVHRNPYNSHTRVHVLIKRLWMRCSVRCYNTIAPTVAGDTGRRQFTSRTLPATEIVQRYLDRAHKLNGELGSFITIDNDGALAQVSA
jgi:hypothetical protein